MAALSIVNSLKKTLNGGHPAIANTPSNITVPETGNTTIEPLTLSIIVVLYLSLTRPVEKNSRVFTIA